MLESVLMMLIWLCIIAIAVYVVLWVLGEIGIVLPSVIVKLIYVIAVLVVLLIVARTLLPQLGRMGHASTYPELNSPS
jgi:hypothetical protein